MSGMIWTMEQVAQARGIRTSGDLDAALLLRHGEVVAEELCRRLARRGIEMGRDFGLELSAEDFAFTRYEDPEQPWRVRYYGAWRPTTNRVQLRGGQMDGQFFAVKHPGEPLRVPIVDTTPWFDEGTRASTAMVETAATYELAGWHETDRHWIYDLA